MSEPFVAWEGAAEIPPHAMDLQEIDYGEYTEFVATVVVRRCIVVRGAGEQEKEEGKRRLKLLMADWLRCETKDINVFPQ